MNARIAPPNERWLAVALEYLEKCNLKDAVDLYENMVTAKGPDGHQLCDDWLVAELGKHDLFFLIAHLLRRPDIGHPWLYERCREIERSPDGHLDLWAREHYKSTIVTFGLTIQDILRDPEITVGIFSHTRPIAKKFLLQIKTEFEVNETLKTLYPHILWADPRQDAPKWSEDEGITVKREGNPKESTVEAWGLVDGQPVSKHYKLLVYDDVVVQGSVSNPDMIEKTTNAMAESYNLGMDGGVRRATGTRWHFSDTYRTVLERGTFSPRLYDGTEENSNDIRRPVLISQKAMADKRRDMGPYVFACQILQNPKHDDVQGMKREWLRYWTPDDGRGLNRYLLRDPASTKKAEGDYTADWVIGLGPDDNFYVLALYRDRLNLTERTNRLFELHRRWRPLEVRYEEYGAQADIEHLQSEMERRKYRFEITRVGGKVKKPDRIKRLIPLFENHRIILPHSFHVTTADHETHDMVHDFVENEYLAFPVGAHEDMLDALSRILEIVAVGGEKLSLKWPAEVKRKRPQLVEHGPLDRNMGM